MNDSNEIMNGSGEQNDLLTSQLHSGSNEQSYDKLVSQISTLFRNNASQQEERRKEQTEGTKETDVDAYSFRDGEFSMLVGNLPALIEQYEQMQNRLLLDQTSRSAIYQFSQANPEASVQPMQVVELIRQMSAHTKDVEVDADDNNVDFVRNMNELDVSNKDTASNGNETDSSSEDEIIEDPCIQPKPWEGKNRREAVDDDHTINQESSVSIDGNAAHSSENLEVTRRGNQQKRRSKSRKGSHEPNQNETSILSNNSFAPIRKPLPPALALRQKMRRLSEAEASFALGSAIGDVSRSTDSTDPPSFNGSPLQSEDHLPRSTSYPNTSTPGRSMRTFDIKNRIAEAEQRLGLSNESMDASFSPPNTMSGIRVLSPSFSEHSFHSLGAKSPSYNSNGRTNDPHWQNIHDDDVEESSFASEADRVLALEAERENLKRTISEKKRTIESLQRDLDETISRLQKEVDDLQSELSLKRKEEALNRVRENNHLASIADLEAELAKETKDLEDLRIQHAKLRADNDQLASTLEIESTNGHEQTLKIKYLTADKATHIAKEKQSDLHRQELQDRVQSLTDDIKVLQKEVEDHESDKREIEHLQNTIDQLNAELNEARNQGSHFLSATDSTNSRQSTLGRSLNQELARQILLEKQERENATIVQQESSMDSEPGNVSVGSLAQDRERTEGTSANPTLTITEREADTSMYNDVSSTVGDMNDRDIVPNEESTLLPSYDEAEVTKTVMQRMHPPWFATSMHELQFPLAGKTAQAYLQFAQRSGSRCREIEGRLEQFNDSEEVEEGKKVNHLSICIDALQEGLRKSNGMTWFFAGLIVTWICLASIGMIGNDKEGYSEDLQAWQISNTLQVPWSVSGSFDQSSQNRRGWFGSERLPAPQIPI